MSEDGSRGGDPEEAALLFCASCGHHLDTPDTGDVCPRCAVPLAESPPLVGEHPKDRHFTTAHLRAGLRSRSVKGGVDMLAGQGVKFVIQMGSIVILARLVAPDDWGLFTKVMAALGLVSLFKEMGLGMAAIQRDHLTHAQATALFWINLCVAALLAGLGSAVAPLLAWFYGDSQVVSLGVVLSLFFLFGGLSAQQMALLRRQMRFRTVVTIDIIALAVAVASAVLAALGGLSYWALAIQQGVHHGVLAVLAWCATRWVPGLPRRAEGVLSMVKFGGFLMGSRVVAYGSKNVDKIVMGRFFADAQLGFYGRAYAMTDLPVQHLFFPVSGVAVSALSRTRDDPSRFRRAFLDAFGQLALVAMPILGCAIAGADLIIRIVLGPDWGPAGELFRVLGFVALVHPIVAATSWVFICQGRTDLQFRLNLVKFALILPAIFAGLPWGPLGVAAGYAGASALLFVPLAIHSAGRVSSVSSADIYKAFVLYLTSSVIALAASALFRSLVPIENAFLGLLAVAPVYGAVYVAFIALFPGGRRGLRVGLASAIETLERTPLKPIVSRVARSS